MGTDAADFSADEWAQICLSNLLAESQDHVYFKDTRSAFIRVSSGVINAASQPRAELRGLPVSCEADLVGKSDFDLFTGEQAAEAFATEQEIMRTGLPSIGVIERQTWPDRAASYVLTNKMPLHGPDGAVIGTFGVSRDVTDDLLLRRQLESILTASPDAISRFDPDLRYGYVNPAAEQMLGRQRDEVIGRTHQELGLDTEYAGLWRAALARVFHSGEPSKLEHSGLTGADRLYYESMLVVERDGTDVTGVLVLTRDITERKRAEMALAEQAVHDPLTGLANRVLLVDRIEQSLRRLDRAPGSVAVLFLDVDRFKLVNDTLGHAFGDALLNEFANRLRGCARAIDTVARLGGDEFVILVDRINGLDDAAMLAGRVARELAAPFAYDGRVVHLTASVGIATTSDSGSVPENLIRDADTAMYRAKESGHGRYAFFDTAMRDEAARHLEVDTELRAALDLLQLRVHYQPQHVMSTGVIRGVEALVRWQHPVRGLVLPAEFVPIAERSNLIVAIDTWVLGEACRQLANWNARRDADDPLTMAVNVSARQLGDARFLAAVDDALRTNTVEPSLLCLEMTESALLEQALPSPEVIAGLRRLGVILALDDFGTGYSSLSHLRRFPVDILKIDREFIEGVADRPAQAAIVTAILGMAHALGMSTVADGVETQAERRALTELGCDVVQGNVLSRPMAASELSGLLGLA
ncbi:MAG: hypothetical protein JWM93_1315 [Frankiales bacterium]|nr:hypothetical protein [Frankiales bacterium]